jgi:hypothetical protein
MLGKEESLAPLSEEEQAFSEKILALFEEQDEQGEYIHSDESVRSVLPALLLGAGVMPSVFTHGPVKGLFAEFRQKMKLPDEVSDQDYLIASRRYYRKYPPDKQLMEKLRESLN